MSTLKDCIKLITTKNHNKIKLNKTEKKIYKEFNKILTHDIFINNNQTPNIDTIINNISTNFIQNKFHIIKLIFSNDQHIYTTLKILKNIEYFKIMFDGYNFDNDCIIDIVMIKEMDNYYCMENVLYYITNNTCIKSRFTFQNLYDSILFLDFIHYNDLFEYLIQLHIDDYTNITTNAIEHIYNILSHNGVKYENEYFVNLLKLCDDIDNNAEIIFNSNIFKDCIINENFGYKFILNHKKIMYYDYLTHLKHYHQQMIPDLLNVGDHDSWIIIINIIDSYEHVSSDSNDNWDSWDSDDSDGWYQRRRNKQEIKQKQNKSNLNNIYDIMLKNIDKITEIIFDYNINLNTKLNLELMIKFNKINRLTMIANRIIIDQNVELYDTLLNFIKLNNKDFDPSKVNMDYIAPTNKPFRQTNEIHQILSYIPFNYKIWIKCGVITHQFLTNNKITIITKNPKNIDITIKNEILFVDSFCDKYIISQIDQISFCNYDWLTQKIFSGNSNIKIILKKSNNNNKINYNLATVYI